MTEEQKIESIRRLANHKVSQAIEYYIGLSYSVETAFVKVLENAELIRGFTQNDILKCRRIGIAIGYYVKAERYIVRQSKNRNEAFIQNGFAYILAK